jgi:hypothetical protein
MANFNIGGGWNIGSGFNFTTSTNIVTTGLVLSLDAGDTSSYAGSGSTWTDISGNGYNATLYNSPTFTSSGSASYFNFNGTNQYGLSTYLQPAYTTSSSFSWNVWYQTSGSNGSPLLIGARTLTGGSASEWTKIRMDGQFEWQHPGSGTIYAPSSISLTGNTWYNLCYVNTAGSMQLYINGSASGSAVSLTTNATATAPFFIGGNNVYSEYAQVKVAVVQVYANTALTSGQVTTNFNALKTRYGL